MKSINKFLKSILTILTLVSNLFAKDFYKGADVSFLKEMEDSGAIYTENGIQKDCLQILKDNGVNFIRLK